MTFEFFFCGGRDPGAFLLLKYVTDLIDFAECTEHIRNIIMLNRYRKYYFFVVRQSGYKIDFLTFKWKN